MEKRFRVFRESISDVAAIVVIVGAVLVFCAGVVKLVAWLR